MHLMLQMAYGFWIGVVLALIFLSVLQYRWYKARMKYLNASKSRIEA